MRLIVEARSRIASNSARNCARSFTIDAFRSSGHSRQPATKGIGQPAEVISDGGRCNRQPSPYLATVSPAVPLPSPLIAPHSRHQPLFRIRLFSTCRKPLTLPELSGLATQPHYARFRTVIGGAPSERQNRYTYLASMAASRARSAGESLASVAARSASVSADVPAVASLLSVANSPARFSAVPLSVS